MVLTNIAIMASSITLSVLAAERYHALLKPFRTGLRLTEDNRELKQQAFLRTRTSEKSREPGSRTAFLAPNPKVKRSTFLKHERRR